MKVPLLDLRAQYAPLRSELLEAVTRVCDSQQFILGPEVEALEHDLAKRLERRPCHHGLIRDRCHPRRAHGARHRPRRRSHHQHVFVLRHRWLRRPCWVRPRCWSTSPPTRSTLPRTRSKRQSPRALARSCRCTSSACVPIWIRSWRPRAGEFRSSKMRVRRSAPAIAAVRRAAWDERRAFRFFPAKISAASAMADW